MAGWKNCSWRRDTTRSFSMETVLADGELDKNSVSNLNVASCIQMKTKLFFLGEGSNSLNCFCWVNTFLVNALGALCPIHHNLVDSNGKRAGCQEMSGSWIWYFMHLNPKGKICLSVSLVNTLSVTYYGQKKQKIFLSGMRGRKERERGNYVFSGSFKVQKSVICADYKCSEAVNIPALFLSTS